MLFNSISFLYYFLPTLIIIYFITPKKYKNIILLVPMYCSNPSSLYFIFSERMQDFFNNNSNKWNTFIKKLKIVHTYNKRKEV